MISDPNALMALSRCYRCLPAGTQREVQVYLMTKWAGSGACMFFYTPPDQPIAWRDKNGDHEGNLSDFYVTSDLPSVDIVGLQTDPSSISTNIFTAGCLQFLPDNLLFTANGCEALTAVDFTGVKHLFALDLGETAVVNLSFPDLISVTGLNQSMMIGSAHLVSLSAPGLTSINGDLDLTGCFGLPQLSLPSLVTVNGNLTGPGNVIGVLSVVDLPKIIFTDGGTIDFSGCKLTSQSVNSILHRGVVSALTSSIFQLNGGTNSPPTGQGIIDKAALITAGCTVTTN